MRKKLYKNQYLTGSLRLPNWNYNLGCYFVTICTKNMKCWFGKVINNKIKLNKLGRKAEECWYAVPDHFPHVLLDEIIIMPNHIHGILQFTPCRNTINHVSIYAIKNNFTNSNPMKNPSSLSNIIRSFKSRCTYKIRKTNPNFQWQTNYFEKIIWNENMQNTINNYIRENPIHWKRGRFRSG